EAIASVRNLTKEEQLQYDRTRKVYRDNLAVEAYAKEREQKFKEKEQEFKERERKIKAKEQKAEAALKNTVRNLKQMGMDTEAIAKATGLTPEEVEKL
ncbi:MAG: hypothetical protein LBL78_00570, partial [Prevotellaceae bacterium]|nr:hypothetical protein [Prevotellaceae bacterium]